MPETERGLFIVLEGIDNCGKTTQSNLLRRYLEDQGRRVIQTREPGGTPDGEKIREILLNRTPDDMLDPLTQTLLFYASRREFLKRVIKPNIDAGISVISDRFEASTYVYQGVVQGVTGEFIYELSRRIVGEDYRPDVYAILDITAEESFKRLRNANNQGQSLVYEQQGLELMQQRVEGYRKYAKGYLINSIMWTADRVETGATLLDGMRLEEDVHKDITELVNKEWERIKQGGVKKDLGIQRV